jgi:hypothetical protein
MLTVTSSVPQDETTSLRDAGKHSASRLPGALHATATGVRT